MIDSEILIEIDDFISKKNAFNESRRTNLRKHLCDYIAIDRL
jgi:hypothetical protein